MSPRPAPRTLLAVLLCLIALLVSSSVLAQEAPVDSLSPTPDPQVESPAPDLVATLSADGRFTVFLDALAQTGLDSTLAAVGPVTIFAPTDSAFAALPEGSLESLTTADLRTLLLYHVVEGRLDTGTVGPIATLAGPELDLIEADGQLIINGETAAGQAVTVSNGSVHVIGAVLLPPAPTE